MGDTEFGNGSISDKNYFSLIRDLLQYIKDNKIEVGSKLPDELSLSAALCASRPTLREALKVLEAFGIIDSRRGAGNVYVRDLSRGLANMMIFYSLINGPSGNVDSISLRATIESQAVVSFIENATEEDYQELIEFYQKGLIRSRTSDNYLDSHTKFHLHLMKYYENELARDFVASNISMVGESPYYEVDYSDEEKRKKVEEMLEEMRDYDHDKILKAVLSKDVNIAQRVLIAHVLIPTKKYLEQL